MRNLLALDSEVGEDSRFKSRSRLNGRILRQRGIEFGVECVVLPPICGFLLVFVFRHGFLRYLPATRSPNFSRKICLARKTLERTAASLIRRIFATSFGDISSIVESTR